MTLKAVESQAAHYQEFVQLTGDFMASVQKATNANLAIAAHAIEIQKSSLEIVKSMLTWAAQSNVVMTWADHSMRSAMALIVK